MLGMSIEQLIPIGLQSQHIIKLLMVKVCVPMTGSASFCQGYLIYIHQPKYTFVWDVQTVLEYIKVNWTVNNVLSDKLLSLKLSMLLALASASTTIQIQHLNISQTGHLPDQYKFVSTKLHKSWKKGKSPPSVSFFAYTEDPRMCVVKCLDAYLDRTKV